ncbi:MAG: hypothetical protein HQL30_11825 [Candidatus Omnitrophica bacterium]|nr:hypothetical protein [Candidatus Omnitrophota bacterium]
MSGDDRKRKLKRYGDDLARFLSPKPAEPVPAKSFEPAPSVAPGSRPSPGPRSSYAPDPSPTMPVVSGPAKNGVGLYIGTSYVLSQKSFADGLISINRERNAFLKVRDDQSTNELISKMGMMWARVNEKLYVIGDSALKLANIFERSTQRPMQIGVLNPLEHDSIAIMKIIIGKVTGSPKVKNEICCFSVPANPFDTYMDIIYYQGILETILSDMGFSPIPLNEGYAVILSELEGESYTGLGISCSGGMVNVCASYKSINMLSFSIAMGGDWIDNNAATALAIPVDKVTEIKESGMNILSPKNREEEAISIYYKHFIHYFMEKMTQVFSVNNKAPQFEEPITVVFSGGPAVIGGFMDAVNQETQKLRMPFRIKKLTISENASATVAHGCYKNAILLA